MVHRLTFVSLALAGLLASIACAAAPATVADGVLTGKNGFTLYTTDRDTAGSGKSVCNGGCATNWPPLLVEGDAQASGDYSVVTRDDGAKQVAYKGKPLYYWVKDTKAGEKTGEGVGKVWHAATP